jgi:hypothetical protein
MPKKREFLAPNMERREFDALNMDRREFDAQPFEDNNE